MAVGDYVVVNLGYAIQKVSQTEAMAAWEITLSSLPRNKHCLSVFVYFGIILEILEPCMPNPAIRPSCAKAKT